MSEQNQENLYKELHSELIRRIENGDIRIELCGHLEDAGLIKGFTLDKRKYRMRIEDETEESMRVIIERKSLEGENPLD